MKRLLILICALGTALNLPAAPADEAMRQAVADARTAIDRAELLALERQSLEELNAAAREQAVRELKLTREQRKRFDPLYDAYRRALAGAVRAERADAPEGDEAAQCNSLKNKLENISATARVKRDYVDRFAEVLTAEQIRLLYNAEGQIATSIKRASGSKRSREVVRLKGDGHQVTQDWGAAGDYTGIAASAYFQITVSPTARTITVTADEQLIDHIALDRTDGVLRFRHNAEIRAQNTSIDVKVTVPASASLRSLSAGSYGRIECPVALRGDGIEVSVSTYGSVKADLQSSGRTTLKIAPYGKFEGSVTCDACEFALASYGSASGPIVCRSRGVVTIGSYARFSDPVKAPSLEMAVSSGALMGGAVECDDLQLRVGSYARFEGAIRALRTADIGVSSGALLRSDIKSGTLALELSSYAKCTGSVESDTARMTVLSGASVDVRLAAERFEATVGSYGKVRLDGDAQVAKGVVTLSSGAAFAAPGLRVADYEIRAQSYSKAKVWCSGELRVEAAPTAGVTYDGPCRLSTMIPNIRRR